METAKTDQGRIGFLGEFVYAPLEQAFREKHIREDRRLGFACAGVVLAGSSFFIVNGYFVYGMSASFFILLATRIANILASLGLILAFRRSPTATQVDRLLLTWGTICVGSSLVIILHGSRNDRPCVTSFGVPLVAYCIVPLPQQSSYSRFL